MKVWVKSHFAASLLGGLVVAGGFLALGVTGRRSTQLVVQQAPVDAHRASSTSALTPHAIYVRDAPGVVFVRAHVVEQAQDPFGRFRQEQQSQSTGSGFLIDRAGDILTDDHVIEGADRTRGVTVDFENGVTRRASVAGVDRGDDLALLRVDIRGVPDATPLELGDSRTVQVGDPTLAIGDPFGFDRTLTSGIVSALQRQIPATNGFSIDNVIQTDGAIDPGDSGGPLLDAVGRVIGINSQIESDDDDGNGGVGIAFAVPIDTAKALLPRLERPVSPLR
jgi:S1-C subfamily serine protease